MAIPKNIDEYISAFEDDVRQRLESIRKTVKDAVPEAVEKISYAMPAFAYYGNLVYFAAFRNHIGFYALPEGNKAFQAELANYKTGKGSIQFPHSEVLPLELIADIAKFRAQENLSKALSKKPKK